MRHAPAVFLGLFRSPLCVIKAGQDDGVVDTLLSQIFFLGARIAAASFAGKPRSQTLAEPFAEESHFVDLSA